MKKVLWVVILVVAVGVVYYMVARKKSMTVSLAEQNKSGESATAVFKEINGKVQVTLTVAGQPAGVVQPAHIHKGTCANIGATVYPLTFPKDGAPSVTLLDTTLADMKTMGPLAMNVHKSVPETQVYVACGELKF